MIGAISGLISFLLFNYIPALLDYAPGIVFGIAIFLFGEFSSLPPIGKRKRVYSFLIIIVSSTVGWYLALQFGGGGEGTIFSSLIKSIYTVLPIPHFLAAGMIGSAFIVLSELLCWRFTIPRWIYAVCIIAVAGLSGLITIGGFIGLFVIWQACVLTIHAIAFGVPKKQLIITAAMFVIFASGISAMMALNAKAERERIEKETAQKEAEDARTARERAEEEKKEFQRRKEEAEKKAEEERKAREAAETREQAGAYITQVSSQLDFAGGYFVNNGFRKTHDYKIDALHNGGTASFTLTLLSGWQYNLISTCDNDCSDIDIYVYDGSGNQIASNTNRDDKPVVTVNVYRGGEFRVKVVMYKCNSSPCAYGIGAFGKG